MHLDVIGAGPAYTDRPGATGASYLVRLGDSSVLLDLGQGSFARLAGILDPATLDAVVISHLHPDHFIDLVALRHYLRWEKPRRRVRVIGPAGLDARLDALHDEPGFSAASLDVEPLTAGTIEIGAFTIQAARVTHTEASFGFRVSEAAGRGASAGPSLVYSGDCGRSEDLDPLIHPGDTLLCEVSFGPGPVDSRCQSPRWADGRRPGATDPRGPRPAHAPSDGLRPRRHDRERQRTVRRARRARRPGFRDDRLGRAAPSGSSSSPEQPKMTEAPHRNGGAPRSNVARGRDASSGERRGTAAGRRPRKDRRPAGRWA